VTLIDLTIAAAFVGWGLFAFAFITRPRLPSAPGGERARDRTSVAAIVLQGLGYGLVWGFRRPLGTPILPVSHLGLTGLLLLTAALAIGSGLFAIGAVRALGRNWSLAARVLESHTLVTTGPYAVVRHPIYTAMLGLMIATGIALSRWEALLAGVVIFTAATLWRTRIEERLLRQSFGAAYDRYVEQVPALLPGWRLK
jgi:protein-S-isoprenylcysteine O-methyltransferase Ste14